MELSDYFNTAVHAVRGDSSVARVLNSANIAPPDQIIAVGKAATAMAQAAHAKFPDAPVTIVTKYHHADGAPDNAEVIESAHPVLDENSLRAGARLREIVGKMPHGSHLMMLVSGGASALAEDPIDGLNLQGLIDRANTLLGSGADIHAMNAVRRELSQIKGGKLLAAFKGDHVTTLAISDVEGDDLNVIGSGIGAVSEPTSFEFSAHIVASNEIARQAILQAAGAQATDHGELLYDDITRLAPRIATLLRSASPGIHILGGEPTVVLPPDPGQGGRNQALALMIARDIAGTNGLEVLVAGTDGTDGPTDAAGAIIDGQTWHPSAQTALDRADAGSWLDTHGALLKTGPTGTNVMDLVIAKKS